MMVRRTMLGAIMAGLLAATPAAAQLVPSALVSDPPADAAHPASMAAVQIPTGGVFINGVVYQAAGQGPHPALVLLHGFPGNEQNLDLAQAARRAGWTVLTLHYRGSWGSLGAFSFHHCLEDSAAALAYLRDPANAARLGVDSRRIAIAGHSMGGLMAARTMANDKALLGVFLIDPWNIAATGRLVADPAALADFRANELDGDLPPLSGTSAEALIAEMRAPDPAIDLIDAISGMSGRRIAIYSATRGGGNEHAGLVAAARKANPAALTEALAATDHSFSDKRIALASALVTWLGGLP